MLQSLYKALCQFHKRLNTELSYDSATLLLGIYPRELKHMSTEHLCMNVYSNIIHNSQKGETMQISTNWWMINKMWCTHTIDYYLAVKRKEVLTHATTWMNFKEPYTKWEKPVSKDHVLCIWVGKSLETGNRLSTAWAGVVQMGNNC